MDMNSLVSTLLSSATVSGISQSTNTSQKEASSVLNAALPLLLNGAKEQSQNSATSAGFANALLNHGKVDASNIGTFLQGVDLTDGGKIVSHLLGTNAVAGIAKEAGVSKKKTNNILSAVAPLLMTLLGQQLGSGNGGTNAALIGTMAASLLGNMDVGSLLGGLLGAETNQTATTTASGKKKKKKKKKKSANGQNSNSGGGILNALLNLLRG